MATNAPTVLFLEKPEPLPSEPSEDQASLRYTIADRWSHHPANGLTPQRLVGIYRAAECGHPAEQCDLFEDVIEQDAHLRALLEARLRAVSGKPWSIQPASDEQADVDAAGAFQDALVAAPNTGAMFRHHLKTRRMGFGGSEILWERVNGRLDPIWFALVPHRRFVFTEQDYPQLLTNREPFRGEPLEAGRWIFSREDGRIAAAAGLMRTATFWSMFKRRNMGHWLTFCERYGVPLPFATYSEDTPEKEREVLKKAVKLIGKDGYAVFLDTCKLDTLKVEGGRSDGPHGSVISICNTELSKLVAGGTLTSETAGQGSWALGQVHADVFFNLLLDDEAFLSETITRDLATPFIKFNGFPVRRPPTLKVHLVKENTPEARMKIFRDFVDMGGEVDTDQVRREMQIKPAAGAAISQGTERFFQYEIEGGVVTINEVRARRSLPPITDGDLTLPQYRAKYRDVFLDDPVTTPAATEQTPQ